MSYSIIRSRQNETYSSYSNELVPVQHFEFQMAFLRIRLGILRGLRCGASRQQQNLGSNPHSVAWLLKPSLQLVVLVNGCSYVNDQNAPSSIANHLETSILIRLCSATDSSSHFSLFLNGPLNDGKLAATFFLSSPSWSCENGGTALRRVPVQSSIKRLLCRPTFSSIDAHRRSNGGHQSLYGVPCARHSPHM